MQIRFDGRTAIVTGAAHRLRPRHRAELCESGCTRGGLRRIGGRTRSKLRALAKEQGHYSSPRAFNVSDLQAVHALADGVLKANGRIDILVNNAGGVMGQVWQADRRGLGRRLACHFAVNLRRRLSLQPGGEPSDEGVNMAALLTFRAAPAWASASPGFRLTLRPRRVKSD